MDTPLALPLVPKDSRFMGRLLKPVIASIANRLATSHNHKLLLRFIGKAFESTGLQNTQPSKAITNDIENMQYNVALNTVKATEQELPINRFLPKNFEPSCPLPISKLSNS